MNDEIDPLQRGMVCWNALPPVNMCSAQHLKSIGEELLIASCFLNPNRGKERLDCGVKLAHLLSQLEDFKMNMASNSHHLCQMRPIIDCYSL